WGRAWPYILLLLGADRFSLSNVSQLAVADFFPHPVQTPVCSRFKCVMNNLPGFDRGTLPPQSGQTARLRFDESTSPPLDLAHVHFVGVGVFLRPRLNRFRDSRFRCVSIHYPI